MKRKKKSTLYVSQNIVLIMVVALYFALTPKAGYAQSGKEKIDVLVFKGGQTLEAVVTGEDASKYYVRVPGGSAEFSKSEVTEVRRAAYTGTLELPKPRENPFKKFAELWSGNRPANQYRPGRDEKEIQAVRQRRIEWDKKIAEDSRLANQQRSYAAPAGPSASSSSSGDKFAYSDIAAPCPYSQQ